MSTDDSIFLAGNDPLGEVAGWLGAALGLEPVDDPELKDGVFLFRGSARTVAGDLFVLVEPNVYGEIDPEPEDVSAIDGYQGVADVRYAGSKDEELQEREARALFDELAARQPGVAMVLAHNMALLTAAYLPGAGIKTFPPRTTLDAADLNVWRPWVVTT
ncbi:hypothetical protein PWY87_10470 [Kribbella solani]|uniref:hypothetical protein n=1 Tax=Kribbella solani TaxID=236067 RepID=UPI0029AB17C8|nr:hypothetical protein [Kribbella solani]MDX2973679.1 hypothetical protein [Kribbella solani]MDX3002095.1 hypothetical protein [Kribbella solani]